MLECELDHSPAQATGGAVKQCKRWGRGSKVPSTDVDRHPEVRAHAVTTTSDNSTVTAEVLPPPEAPQGARRRQRASTLPSYCLQHYHSTGCAGGAFAWRAAKMDPEKCMFLCKERREFRPTTMEDIKYSLADKKYGGGPRVGSFQESIPGNYWESLPKYDFTSRKRSSAYNERMHVEWENHVDHILSNDGELPTASVVAKAGFRSCAPCCRDMLALARPTGKTFIMVDLAEDDCRGTFHFVCADKYLPCPKEGMTREEVAACKAIVVRARDNGYASSQEIYESVIDLGVPVDETAQALYLGDRALFPPNSASYLKGDALLEVLHAEHFARLTAEYGASILRDLNRPRHEKEAVYACRARAEQSLIHAWWPHLSDTKLRSQLQAYAAAAIAPLLPEEPNTYLRLKRSKQVPSKSGVAAIASKQPPVRGLRWSTAKSGLPTAQELTATVENTDTLELLPASLRQGHGQPSVEKTMNDDDAASSAGWSTTAPSDGGLSTEANDENDWDDTDFVV